MQTCVSVHVLDTCSLLGLWRSGPLLRFHPQHKVAFPREGGLNRVQKWETAACQGGNAGEGGRKGSSEHHPKSAIFQL